jgi:type VI protein secretion system component Hcp
MSDEIKKDEQVPEVKTEASGESLPEKELSAEDLNNLTGGNTAQNIVSGALAGDKVVHGDFQITKVVDAASPKL